MDRPIEVQGSSFERAALTRSQTAKALQVGEDAVTRLLAEGRLEGVKVGHRWRISPRSVLEFATGGGQ